MGDIVRFDYDGVIATSGKAVLIDYRGDEMWIPRSAIVEPEDGNGMERGDPPGEIAVLSWIARDRGIES